MFYSPRGFSTLLLSAIKVTWPSATSWYDHAQWGTVIEYNDFSVRKIKNNIIIDIVYYKEDNAHRKI